MTLRRILAVVSMGLLIASPLAGCSSDTDDNTQSADTTTSQTEDSAVAWGEHVDEDAFAQAIDDGAKVIDVRTPAEYAEGHLPGAENIDVQDPQFLDKIANLDAGESYAIYCRSGNRSRTALDMMQSNGIQKIVGLDGGISSWSGDIEK